MNCDEKFFIKATGEGAAPCILPKGHTGPHHSAPSGGGDISVAYRWGEAEALRHLPSGDWTVYVVEEGDAETLVPLYGAKSALHRGRVPGSDPG